jgi:hypothetical protein
MRLLNRLLNKLFAQPAPKIADALHAKLGPCARSRQMVFGPTAEGEAAEVVGKMARWWGLLDKIGTDNGPEVVLDANWVVREIDDCLAGHTLEFYCQGLALFKVGYWHGRLSVNRDISQILGELKAVIDPAIDTNPSVQAEIAYRVFHKAI